MKFNSHWNQKDRHAVLAPSNYSWLRYDDAKMIGRLKTMRAAQEGSELHQLANDLIKKGLRLEGNKTTMARYVRDAVGFHMTPELTLYYSDNCFGTADALGFRKERGDTKFTLRIFDLKTGESKVSFDQLLIYCALFCLEYGFKPFDILYELRIYQMDDILEYMVDPKEVVDIMDHIIHLDKLINNARNEEIV